MSQKLLVTGASGQLGQRVLHHLLNTLGVAPEQIVATTRKPESLATFAEKGVTVRVADFDNAVSLEKAFEDINRLLLISTDALDRPGHRLQQHRSAIAAAEKAGVTHVIYTSMPNPEKSIVLFAPDHAGTEASLKNSTLSGWTILRNHWYYENIYMMLTGILANGGQWFHAAGNGKLANISRDDLARAAASVLADSTDGKHVYTLSGEQALTTAEQAQLISDGLGKQITAISVPVEGLIRGLLGAGLPEPLARILASFDENTAAGYVETVTADYRRITGLAPQTFADWLQTNKHRLLAA